MLKRRLLDKVRKDPETGCWRWLGMKGTDGHPRISRNGRLRSARRAAFEEWMGPIAPGHVLDELCGHKFVPTMDEPWQRRLDGVIWPCIRPDHHDPVTKGEQGRRRSLRVRVAAGDGEAKKVLAKLPRAPRGAFRRRIEAADRDSTRYLAEVLARLARMMGKGPQQIAAACAEADALMLEPAAMANKRGARELSEMVARAGAGGRPTRAWKKVSEAAIYVFMDAAQMKGG